jgi:hypothetical protein
VGPGHNQRSRVTKERMTNFALILESWDRRELRAVGVEGNVARFRNEFRDVYNEVFPLIEDERKTKEKPWLNDPQFKVMFKEKGELFSRKVKGREQEGDRERLAEVAREVNKTRQRLRRAHFSQRLEGVMGDAKATWEVLGEVLGGGRRKSKGAACGFFRKDGVGLTDRGEIAEGFCKFYSQVGPKLVEKIKREKEGAF